ncbi:MAG: hypothetical protein QF357_07790 [Dehalococcoidia bacterium]|nr:hypothetical protein [Dehalococcoidia bacterium]
MTVDRKPEDISVLLASSIERSRFLVESKALDLQVDITRDPSVVQLEIDVNRMTQVFFQT